MMREIDLCRSWLFLPGADRHALMDAVDSGADVLIQELEDFTLPDDRPAARKLTAEVFGHWRQHNKVCAVRINPLSDDGLHDLDAVMLAKPDIVALPKVSDPFQITDLADAIESRERALGITIGATGLLPNIELARGIVQTFSIAGASERVSACLMASEDLAADLCAERHPDGRELDYCRQRFLVECTAAGRMAIDRPYTWSDLEGLREDVVRARRIGYQAASCVSPAQPGVVNDVLTPDADEIARAKRIVDAFDKAREKGKDRVEVDGSLVEIPTRTNASRILQRASALSSAEDRG